MMPRYLLSTRAILDIAKNKNLPAQVWFERYSNLTHYQDEIYICSVSRIQVNSFLDAKISARKSNSGDSCETVHQLSSMRGNAASILDWFSKNSTIISMNEGIAEIWGALMFDEIVYRNAKNDERRISIIEKIELATAIHGLEGLPLNYVVQNQEALRSIDDLKIEDLDLVQ